MMGSMKNCFCTIMMLLLALSPAAASDFVQNAIHYQVSSESSVVVVGFDSSDKDGSDVFIHFETPAQRNASSNQGYSIQIPEKVTNEGKTYEVVEIGKSAFVNLYSMRTIELPASITSIGDAAFAGCSGLDSIYCFADTPPTAFANSFASVNKSKCTLVVKRGAASKYAQASAWSDFADITEIRAYQITYLVNEEVYAIDSLSKGEVIVLMENPVAEGNTFSGWSGYPEDLIMPEKDITISGNFIPNRYLLTYLVDGDIYKTDSICYGTEIVPEAEPTKEGYTFSGWSEIPAAMPAHDVEVTGSFAVNYYLFNYLVDGEVYKTDSIAYGTEIVPEAEPTKEGYTFSGWSEIPVTMPAHDVEVTGSFSANTYYIIYKVEGEEYFVDSVKYGAQIVPVEEPEREGYTFSGWQGLPQDLMMPAHDVEVTGTFAVNYYLLTYLVDGEVYQEDSVAFGTEIVLMPNPEKPGYIFSGWSGYPEDLMMPAADVTIVGSFEVDGIQDVAAGAGTDTAYDLLGRKVQTQRKGEIYLQNGKKIMIR